MAIATATAMAIMAGTAIAGAGYSAYSGERAYSAAQKSASKQRKMQMGQIAEEKTRYGEELTRQTEGEAREFEAATADYEQTTSNLEAWKQNWAEMAEDPRGKHPGWPSFETAVTEAASAERSKIEDIYQRRGKSGSGEYLRAVQDIESGREKSLQDALMGITREARGKVFEIEGAMPKRPVLGAPQMFAAPQDYGFTPSPIPAVGDVGGLGQGLALAMDKLRTTKPTSTTAALETGVPTSQQWTIPGAEGQFEGMFGEQMAPQQTQYSLLG